MPRLLRRRVPGGDLLLLALLGCALWTWHALLALLGCALLALLGLALWAWHALLEAGSGDALLVVRGGHTALGAHSRLGRARNGCLGMLALLGCALWAWHALLALLGLALWAWHTLLEARSGDALLALLG